MAALTSISIILLFLFAGMLLAKLKLVPAGRTVDILVNISLFSLLFFMGFRIGRNEEIGRALKQIGIVSIAFAVATVAGTVIVLALIYHLQNIFTGKKTILEKMHKNTVKKDLKHYLSTFASHFKDPAKLVAFVLAGFAAGFFLDAFNRFTGENITSWLLKRPAFYDRNSACT